MADRDVNLRVDVAAPPLDLQTITPTVEMIDGLLKSYLAAAKRWSGESFFGRHPSHWPHAKQQAEFEKLKARYSNVLLVPDDRVTELTRDESATIAMESNGRTAAEVTNRQKLELAAELASALKSAVDMERARREVMGANTGDMADALKAASDLVEQPGIAHAREMYVGPLAAAEFPREFNYDSTDMPSIAVHLQVPYHQTVLTVHVDAGTDDITREHIAAAVRHLSVVLDTMGNPAPVAPPYATPPAAL